MYIVSVDFSKNNLLTEQLNVRSFYDLPILNSTLIELQLKNFADLTVEKVYVTEAEIHNKFPLFEAVSVSFSELYRALFSNTKDENIFLFRNDVYFECDFSSIFTVLEKNEVIGLKDHNGLCFALLCSLKNLKKLYNKNIGFFELLNNCQKYVKSYINADGYIINLKNVRSYKCLLFDILNGKTFFKPPRIAEGVN